MQVSLNIIASLLCSRPSDSLYLSSATYQQSLACDIALKSVSNGLLFPDDLILQHICVDDCLASLEALREDQLTSCSTDTIHIDGAERSPVYLTDVLIYTYNYTCLRDP